MARYKIVPNQSRVKINAKSSLHPIHTETDGLEGWLELDVQGGGKVNLQVPPKGHLELPVDNLQSGNRLEDRELKKRIDARRYPTIDGELKEMEASGQDGSYTVRGDLTFRGQTHTYEDTMKITAVDDDTIKLEGAHEFDIRDFGMEPPKILMLKVHPEVNVEVDITAKKEG